MNAVAPVCAVLMAGSLVAASADPVQQTPQRDTPAATFRSSVDLVRVAAVVRDRKGRFVRDLTVRDFEVLESGRSRTIVDFRPDIAGLSVALLFDVSGSMEAQLDNARDGARHLLSWLGPTVDEAGVFRFDTQFEEVSPFTIGLRELPPSMSRVVPFGATSLYDAVARSAQQVGNREGRRRAVVVFTDGNDTASRLKPADVSAVASRIDVPVYIVAIVSGVDNPLSETSTAAEKSPLTGQLSDLANWTGGHLFVASTPAERSFAARQIIDELRHQYLIAFESSAKPGWHPLVVRARNKDLVVRARSGYVSGQSRPNSL
jgi:VWFA-related protein